MRVRRSRLNDSQGDAIVQQHSRCSNCQEGEHTEQARWLSPGHHPDRCGRARGRRMQIPAGQKLLLKLCLANNKITGALIHTAVALGPWTHCRSHHDRGIQRLTHIVMTKKTRNHLTSASTTRSVSTKANFDARNGLQEQEYQHLCPGTQWGT